MGAAAVPVVAPVEPGTALTLPGGWHPWRSGEPETTVMVQRIRDDLLCSFAEWVWVEGVACGKRFEEPVRLEALRAALD